MKEGCKKTWIALLFFVLCVSDLIAASGINFFGFQTLTLEHYDTTKEKISWMTWVVTITTAIVMTLTRLPAIYKLFYVRGLHDDFSRRSYISSSRRYCANFLIILGYLSVGLITPLLGVVQYLGSKSMLEAMDAPSGVAKGLSPLFAFGSVVGFVAFLYRFGVVENLKRLLFGEPDRYIQSHPSIKGLLWFICLSGTAANSLFAFFTMESAADTIEFLAADGVKKVLASVYLVSIFYMMLFSYVYDTQQLHKSPFTKELAKWRAASDVRKTAVTAGLFIFLINKLIQAYIFYWSGVSVLDKWKVPHGLSIFLSLIFAASATIIISAFEIKPTLNSLFWRSDLNQHVLLEDDAEYRDQFSGLATTSSMSAAVRGGSGHS